MVLTNTSLINLVNSYPKNKQEDLMFYQKFNQPYFEIKLSEVKEDSIAVLSFEGEEHISDLFEYRIELLSKDNALDSSKILNKPATLTFNRGDETPENIHGIISHFEQHGRTKDYTFYKVHLVPMLWRLTLVYQNEIYQNMKINDIIEEVLSDGGLKGSALKIDFKNQYPKHEYVVQYRETNLNFLKRRLEHFGIFFYFDHSGSSDVVVFTDANSKLPDIHSSEAVGFNENKDALGDSETILNLICREKIVTGAVQLKDYNYLFPEKKLIGESQIDSNLPGIYYDYGDNFENEKDAESLAKVRNQEFLAGRKIFEGNSDSRILRAGHKFTLESHFRDDWNDEYIITKVVVRGSQHGLFSNLPESISSPTFECNFTAIPFSIDFRPPRKTPIPRIYGIMSAKIESGSGDEYAFIDDNGRYKAKMLFDINDKTNGEASLPIRLSQGYSGAGYGIHFPNHAGTELLFACIDGNVDRPTGLGTVPNPSNSSPSTGGNKAQSVIRTAGQNELTFDDKTGSENIYLHATKDWTIDVAHDKKQTIGNDESGSVGNNRTRSVGNDETILVKNNRDKTVEGSQTETIVVDKTITVTGNHTETISGNMTQTVESSKAETIFIAKALTIGAAYQVSVGAAMNETILAAKAEEIGAAKSVNVAAMSSENVGADKSVKAGGNITESAGKNISIDAGKDIFIKSGKKGVIDIADQLIIKCGSASITLKKNGNIAIKGNKISIKGSGDVTVKGSKIGEN